MKGITEMNQNKIKHFTLPAMAVVTLLINIIAYKYLPDHVALQISFSGELRNFVPKIVFVFASPAVLMLLYYVNNSKEPGRKFKFIFISLIIFVINIIFIYLNLR